MLVLHFQQLLQFTDIPLQHGEALLRLLQCLLAGDHVGFRRR